MRRADDRGRAVHVVGRTIIGGLLFLLAASVRAEPVYLALLIDDLGYNRAEIQAIVDLPAPVSGAVLPHAPYSRMAAEELHRHGRDVLLHLPMEPQEPRLDDPGVLRRDMTPRELALTVEFDLTTVPHAVGINNHMGSLLTQDIHTMRVLMRELRQQGDLFFLDSLTSAQSVAHAIAREQAIPTLVRDVFLDNDRTPDAIRAQLARAVDKARRHGSAIAIGHPYPETLAVLSTSLPVMERQGVEVVPISTLVTHQTARRIAPVHDAMPNAGEP